MIVEDLTKTHMFFVTYSNVYDVRIRLALHYTIVLPNAELRITMSVDCNKERGQQYEIWNIICLLDK